MSSTNVPTHRSAAVSTLMAHRPIARTDLRTKSTSTSVEYLGEGRGGKRGGRGRGGKRKRREGGQVGGGGGGGGEGEEGKRVREKMRVTEMVKE